MRLLVAAAVAAAVASMAAAVTAGERPPLDLTQRVDARVLADTANGRTAHFLVVMRRQADVGGVPDTVSSRRALGREVVDRLRDAASAQAPLRAELARRGVSYRPFWIVNALAVRGDRALVDALSARADVARIEPDRAFRGLQTTAEPAVAARAATVEWNIQKIQADKLWNLGFKGEGMVYANADTGVAWQHPALLPHYRGWNGTTAVHDYNWHDAIHATISAGTNPCGVNTTAPCDDGFHGTHTMGIGVGDDAAGHQIGVAPGAKWIACRNMDRGVGRPSTYIECLQFFTAPTNLAGGAPNPDLRPHAVGNSYGCPPDEQCQVNSLQAAVDNVRAAGIFMAVSAGNSGQGGVCGTVNDPPAIYDSSITVGSTDINDAIAASSSRGPVVVDGSNRPKPDVAAPGVQVNSSVPPNGYAAVSGTSMASPHVGAAVLLLWQAVPSLQRNVNQTEALLENSAVHLTTTNTCGGNTSTSVPNNTFGYGRIDVLAAYNAAQQPTAVSKVSAGNLLVGEGTRRQITATVTVKLSAARPGGVVVSYRTADGTAKAASDYRATSGTLRFGGKETVKRVRISIVRDAKREPDETFFVVLEKAVGGTITTPRVRITIRNDDR